MGEFLDQIFKNWIKFYLLLLKKYIILVGTSTLLYKIKQSNSKFKKISNKNAFRAASYLTLNPLTNYSI